MHHSASALELFWTGSRDLAYMTGRNESPAARDWKNRERLRKGWTVESALQREVYRYGLGSSGVGGLTLKCGLRKGDASLPSWSGSELVIDRTD